MKAAVDAAVSMKVNVASFVMVDRRQMKMRSESKERGKVELTVPRGTSSCQSSKQTDSRFS